jgi:putative membrane protein
MVRRKIERILFSRTLLGIATLAVLAGVYATFCVWLELLIAPRFSGRTPNFHVTLSLVLGLLLVFRTNAAYARWWEARILWGSLVNASRNLAVKLVTIPVTAPKDEIAAAGRFVIAFPYALRDRLRNTVSQDVPAEFDDFAHKPSAMVKRLYELFTGWRREGHIDGMDLRIFDAEATKLLEICGACERILGTRMTRSYRRFARQCVVLFLLILPWEMAVTLGWWAAPMVVVIAYFMIGLEVVAEHVEEPFGHDEDDLDLDGLCATIHRSASEILGDKA